MSVHAPDCLCGKRVTKNLYKFLLSESRKLSDIWNISRLQEFKRKHKFTVNIFSY